MDSFSIPCVSSATTWRPRECAAALFGFRILDPLPAARQTVIEQMHAGMVVFDAKWQVVSLNPAAERITGIRAAAARGKTWQQLRAQGALLPTLPWLTTMRPSASRCAFS